MMILRQKRANLLGAVAVGVIASALPAAAAAEQDVTLIVSRTDRAVEIFLGMSARTAVGNFGLDPVLLTGPDGVVAFEDLRQGTWDIGDDLLAGTEARIGTAPARFEATSLMVHLKDWRLPFETPLDGLTAISVCGVEPPETPPTLDDLYLYAGFVAYPDDFRGALRLTPPDGDGAAMQVIVRDHGAGLEGAPVTVRVVPGETLVVGAADRVWPWIAAAGAMLLAAGGVVLGVRYRQGPVA